MKKPWASPTTFNTNSKEKEWNEANNGNNQRADNHTTEKFSYIRTRWLSVNNGNT